MKHILIIVLLFLSGSVFGQGGFSFVTEDLNEARRIADSIALTGPRQFRFEKVFKFTEDAKEVSFVYVSNEKEKMNYNKEIIEMYKEVGLLKSDPKPPNVKILIEFFIFKKEDGTKFYRFNKVEGAQIIDIFPFWSKYIEPKANLKNILDNGRSVSEVGQKKFILNDMGRDWDFYLDLGI